MAVITVIIVKQTTVPGVWHVFPVLAGEQKHKKLP